MKRLLYMCFAAALILGGAGCTLEGDLDGELEGDIDMDGETAVDVEWPEFFEIIDSTEDTGVVHVSTSGELLEALKTDAVVIVLENGEEGPFTLSLDTSISVDEKIINLNGNTL